MRWSDERLALPAGRGRPALHQRYWLARILGEHMTEEHIIGKSGPRKEGRDKVTGAARYIDDMTMPGMIYGATVRSQIPRGVIKHISFDPQFEWSEFVVVKAQDIPGKNCIALIGDDQPCLADGRVHHPEEPIMLLAHADPHLLRTAISAVVIEYEPLPAIFTIERAKRNSRSSG